MIMYQVEWLKVQWRRSGVNGYRQLEYEEEISISKRGKIFVTP